MKPFYVEHSALTTARFALLAKDEVDLKSVLQEREANLRAAPFTAKWNAKNLEKSLGTSSIKIGFLDVKVLLGTVHVKKS